MAPGDGLFLHEEVMLLALRDQQGTVAPGAMYQYAVGGAILAELLLANRVAVDSSGRRQLVRALDAEPVGDPLVDECLKRIADAKRRASLKTWVSRFAGIKDLKGRVAERLCDRGILRAEEAKVLLIFSRTTFPEVDPKPEDELIERLNHAIFANSGDVDPRTAVLLSLAHGADLLKAVIDKRKLKERKARIERIINGELTGKATREAIEAMHAAMAVAAIMPAIMVTTVNN